MLNIIMMNLMDHLFHLLVLSNKILLKYNFFCFFVFLIFFLMILGDCFFDIMLIFHDYLDQWKWCFLFGLFFPLYLDIEFFLAFLGVSFPVVCLLFKTIPVFSSEYKWSSKSSPIIDWYSCSFSTNSQFIVNSMKLFCSFLTLGFS